MENKSRAIFLYNECDYQTPQMIKVLWKDYISNILKPYEFSLRKHIFLVCLMSSVFQYLKFDGSINMIWERQYGGFSPSFNLVFKSFLNNYGCTDLIYDIA